MTRQQQIEAVKEVVRAVGGEVRTGYSGRGMFGETCYGVVCSDPDDCIEVAAAHGLRGARRDNMGRDYIVYWPSIKGDRAAE